MFTLYRTSADMQKALAAKDDRIAVLQGLVAQWKEEADILRVERNKWKRLAGEYLVKLESLQQPSKEE